MGKSALHANAIYRALVPGYVAAAAGSIVEGLIVRRLCDKRALGHVMVVRGIDDRTEV